MKIKISTIKKVIGILFITLFAAFLVYPNSGLPRSEENAKIVARENRKITPRPTQSLKSKEFYTQFEKWYQDRLRKRDWAIRKWSKFNLNIGVIVHDRIFEANGGWLFHKDMIINDLKDTEVKIAEIKKLQDYCQGRGKNFVLFIPPSKETIYRNLFPEEIQNQYKSAFTYIGEGEKLFKQNNINYLGIYDEILKEKLSAQDPLYILKDSHWDYFGASIGTNLLLTKIHNINQNFQYNGLKLDNTFIETTYPADYVGMLGLTSKKVLGKIPWSKSYTDEIYLIDCYLNKKIKVGALLKNFNYWELIHNGEVVLENKSINSNTKILILSDSYATFMAPYLAQFTKETIITHYNGYSGKKINTNLDYLISKYNPDIIVLEIVDRIFYPASSQALFGKFIY